MPDAPAIFGPPQFRMPTVARVRAHYTLLCAAAAKQFHAGSLAGHLLLIDGLADEGDALLIAASIAGAASLVLETGTEAVRHCVRNGIVDFAVTSLAEALRILKNEVRKRQPIAVLRTSASSDLHPVALPPGAVSNRMDSRGVPWNGATVVLIDLLNLAYENGVLTCIPMLAFHCLSLYSLVKL